MIFISTGTQFPFDRFIKIIDELAPSLDEEVVAQVSLHRYSPKYLKIVNNIPQSEFVSLMSQARLVVAHAGMGTILTALILGKPIIVYPRDAALGEHRNNHQFATAKQLESMRYVYVAHDSAELKSLMLSSALKPLKSIGENASPSLSSFVESFIDA